VSAQVIELADKIKEKGQNSAAELPQLLKKAEELAHDDAQDVLTRALAYRAAGNAHQLLNQFQPALESYNASTSLLETLDEPIELGRTLHAKVGMLFTLSRFDELFTCSTRARQLFEEYSDHKRLARLDVNLAHAYHRLGRPAEALECSNRALRVLEDIKDHEGFIAASINSAVTLTAMHEFESAEERYRRAMRLATELNMSSWVLLSRYNLAYLRYLQGDTADALEELRVLRQEYERTGEEWMICHCWLDEAEILLEVGDFEDCIAAAGHARSLAVALGLSSEIGKSLLYEAIAGIRLGESLKTASLLEEASQRLKAGGDQIFTAAAKLQTALLRSENGDQSALADAISVRSLLAGTGLPHLRALAEIVIGRIHRDAGDHESAASAFTSAMALADNSRSEWMQFHAAQELGLFGRADSLLDSLWNRLGSDDLKMTFLADRETIYGSLVRSSIDASSLAALDYSEKSRSRVLRERLLGQNSKTTTKNIQQRLSLNEAVIEYFIAGDDLFIFLLRRDALICIARPGAVPAVRSQSQDLDRHIESCSIKWEHLAGVHHHLETTARRHLRSLYDELIAPIRSELRETVIFIPHGFLHGVPLHALHDGEQYLAERHQIGYSPSASLYAIPAPAAPADRALLIAFSTDDRASSIDEVKEASSLVSAATVLMNPSLEELRDAFAASWGLVHIAGHAGIDAIGGKFSWIDTPRGKLTSRELSNMSIRANTIVITGCRTARRLIQPGDEWLGLMRSFYLSGASTIVSALWDIRDKAARRFARRFYETFNGSNALSAVQTAAASVRHDNRHPYFWAAFGSFIRKVDK
jgi:CHAT domain-containing protein